MHTATTKLMPGLAALGAAALLALGGPAQAAQTTTLHLVDHAQRGIGFFPAHAPRTGDTVGFGGRVSGDDRGTDRLLQPMAEHERDHHAYRRGTFICLNGHGVIRLRLRHMPAPSELTRGQPRAERKRR